MKYELQSKKYTEVILNEAAYRGNQVRSSHCPFGVQKISEAKTEKASNIHLFTRSLFWPFADFLKIKSFLPEKEVLMLCRAFLRL